VLLDDNGVVSIAAKNALPLLVPVPAREQPGDQCTGNHAEQSYRAATTQFFEGSVDEICQR
jgi:hypothetical protein